VIKGEVITPGRTVLKGITQRTIQELCSELNLPCRAATISPAELSQAEEVFLSSTAGGVMPATRVDSRPVGNGEPGPLTLKLRERYWRKHEEGWHGTPIDYD
jgi:branched-chain amino acid aminotransferase